MVITRLRDVATRHVWIRSVACPAGVDVILEDDDDILQLPGDTLGGDGPLWDLEGAVTDGRWEWDGVGAPRDERGNTVGKIVAFVRARGLEEEV